MKLTHSEKLRLAGIRRFGSEAKWRKHQSEAGRRASRTTPRGFSVMSKERVKQASQKGHQARWGRSK